MFTLVLPGVFIIVVQCVEIYSAIIEAAYLSVCLRGAEEVLRVIHRDMSNKPRRTTSLHLVATLRTTAGHRHTLLSVHLSKMLRTQAIIF